MPEFNEWFPDTYLPSQGFKLQGLNTNCIDDPAWHSPVLIQVSQDSLGLNPNFTSSNVLAVALTTESYGGHNSYRGGSATPGSTTQGKHTFAPLSVSAFHRGSGQRILSYFNQTTVGMGDAAVIGLSHHYYGGPISGDEGQGFGLVSHLNQGSDVQIGTVFNPGSGAVIRSTLDTTTTQVIAQNKDAQTITVASSSGATVGDWVVVEQQLASGDTTIEAVKITAVNSGGANRISGVFRNNHPNGVKVRPATCIGIDGAQGFGQDRVLVNRNGASYTTGQIANPSGGALIGTGTSWSNTMVGGDADNVGAICIETDTYTGYPFSPASPLRSWHQITTVTSTTQLAFHTYSTAGDGAYKGRGEFPSDYIVRPAMRMLHYADGRAICEYSAHTWTIGDVIECVVCPYPTVIGFQYHMAQWTPNGTNNATFMDIVNTGARRLQTCFQMRGNMPPDGGADTCAWGIGLSMSECNVGLSMINVHPAGMECAIRMQCQWANGATNDNGSKIDFGAGFMMIDSAHKGMYFHTTTGGGSADPNDAQLRFIGGVDTPTNADLQNRTRMDYTGSFRLHGWMDIEEVSAAPTAATNIARLYCVDDGAGKTKLMALFESGAAVQLAIEP